MFPAVGGHIKWLYLQLMILPGVDGVESQEVDDMLAGVCGEFGGEIAGLEAEAGESRGPGRGVNGFG